MYREIADGKDNDDNDQHLGCFPPGTQLQFDRGIGINGEHVLITTTAASVMTVMMMIAARLFRKETHWSSGIKDKV